MKYFPGQSLAAFLLCCILCVAAARGATVHKADDTTVTGDIVSLAAGKLTVETKSDPKAKSDRVTIPLSDIVQIVWREPPPPPQPISPTQSGGDDSAQDSGGGFWGALFGANRSSTVTVHSDDAPPSPPPTPPTTRPGSIRWQIQLTGGDALHGYISQWSDQKLSLFLDSPAGQSIDLPAEQLAELWAGTNANTDVAKARALSVDTSAADVVFVSKGSEVVPVKGVILGIAGYALRFRFGDEDRKIALDRVVGIIMSQGGRKTPAETFRQSVALHGGDTLIGKWTALARGSAAFQTNWGQTVNVQLSEVDRIDCLDGRVVYVSDLKPAKVEQVPFFGRVIPFRVDCGLDGGPLKLSDGVYPRGIAVHSRCVLDYAIGGRFARFQAKLGFEQPGGQIGRAAIRVLADGKPIYANPDARGSDKPVAIDCDIAGAQTLTLEVDFGKAQDAGGRVIWANARLLRDMPGE